MSAAPSRQAIKQRQLVAAGLCKQCAKGPLVTDALCAVCALQAVERSRRNFLTKRGLPLDTPRAAYVSKRLYGTPEAKLKAEKLRARATRLAALAKELEAKAAKLDPAPMATSNPPTQ